MQIEEITRAISRFNSSNFIQNVRRALPLLSLVSLIYLAHFIGFFTRLGKSSFGLFLEFLPNISLTLSFYLICAYMFSLVLVIFISALVKNILVAFMVIVSFYSSGWGRILRIKFELYRRKMPSSWVSQLFVAFLVLGFFYLGSLKAAIMFLVLTIISIVLGMSLVVMLKSKYFNFYVKTPRESYNRVLLERLKVANKIFVSNFNNLGYYIFLIQNVIKMKISDVLLVLYIVLPLLFFSLGLFRFQYLVNDIDFDEKDQKVSSKILLVSNRLVMFRTSGTEEVVILPIGQFPRVEIQLP